MVLYDGRDQTEIMVANSIWVIMMITRQNQTYPLITGMLHGCVFLKLKTHWTGIFQSNSSAQKKSEISLYNSTFLSVGISPLAPKISILNFKLHSTLGQLNLLLHTIAIQTGAKSHCYCLGMFLDIPTRNFYCSPGEGGFTCHLLAFW